MPLSHSESADTAARPRRSVLYVPASNRRAIDKSRQLACDAVVLDLEDAVAPDMKSSARDTALAVLREGGFGHREIIVRVNALDTPWGATDLAAISDSSADAVLVPKIRTGQDLLQYHDALSGAATSMRLWAMIETARCLFNLEAIAATARHTRLACLVLGTNDLAKELRLQMDLRRTPLATALSLSVAAARAYGLAVLDGVFNAFDDDLGLEAQCRQGLEYGFDGKTLIHPRQIVPCNAVFSPSAQALIWARKVQAIFAMPENALKGALSLDGAMVERLHLIEAQRLLALDAAIQAAGGA